jgi:hypothetical protein
MKVVLTLVVRDEADVVAAHLAYHFAAGVDLVIATDHRSQDGTTEILESYAREGRLHVIREHGGEIRQSEWMTRMARLAATEHGADWVLNGDADEFWWPRDGSLKDTLAAVPARYGVVRALLRPFVPRPDDGRPFAERMIFRVSFTAAINDAATPFRSAAKAAHRASPDAAVGRGNHHVSHVPGEVLTGWFPIELFHFSLRSPAQVARKHRNTWSAWQENLRGDLARARTAAGRGEPEAFYRRVAVGDATLARGLAAGSLVEDTRLRDVLRSLGQAAASPAAVAGAPRTDIAFGWETLAYADAQLVRAQRRVDELTLRVARRERPPSVWRARRARRSA